MLILHLPHTPSELSYLDFFFLFNFILFVSDYSSSLARSFKSLVILDVVQVDLYIWVHIYVCMHIFFSPSWQCYFESDPKVCPVSFIVNNRGHVQGSHKTSVSTWREVTGSTVLTINQSIWWNNCFFIFFTELTGKLPTDANLKGKTKGKCLGKNWLSLNRRPPQKGNLKVKALAGLMRFLVQWYKQPLWLWQDTHKDFLFDDLLNSLSVNYCNGFELYCVPC